MIGISRHPLVRRGGQKHITECKISSGALGEKPGQASQDRGLAMTKKNDVNRILAAIEQGDPRAADRLLPLVYIESYA
jgi:hypothetical protein